MKFLFLACQEIRLLGRDYGGDDPKIKLDKCHLGALGRMAKANFGGSFL